MVNLRSNGGTPDRGALAESSEVITVLTRLGVGGSSQGKSENDRGLHFEFGLYGVRKDKRLKRLLVDVDWNEGKNQRMSPPVIRKQPAVCCQ
jgi:hypothetical protein